MENRNNVNEFVLLGLTQYTEIQKVLFILFATLWISWTWVTILPRREVFDYYLLKYFLMAFLFVFLFWDSYMLYRHDLI